MTTQQTPGIEIEEEWPFQQRFRVVEFAGAAIGAVLIIAGLVGVFGTGPLAHATKTGTGGVQVDYDRFVRSTASTTIQVTVPRAASSVQVALSRDYLEHAQVSGVDPEPEQAINLPDRRVYVIRQRGTGQVEIGVTPRTIGVRQLRVWVSGRGVVNLTQVVWP